MKYKFKVGDLVFHKYRGSGIVCDSEFFNTDLTSVMIKLDEDGETYEVSVGLVYLLKESNG